jgi:hypothetical protein
MHLLDQSIMGILILFFLLGLVVVKRMATGSILDRPKGNFLIRLVNSFNLFFLLIVNPLMAKKDLPLSLLVQDILTAGRRMLNSAPVQITRYYEKSKKGEIRICPVCYEAYPVKQGLKCLACQGEGYYQPVEASSDYCFKRAIR